MVRILRSVLVRLLGRMLWKFLGRIYKGTPKVYERYTEGIQRIHDEVDGKMYSTIVSGISSI